MVLFAGARWVLGFELNDVAKSAVNAFMSTGLGGYAWDIFSALLRMIIIGILAVQSLRHEWDHGGTLGSCPYPPEDVKAGYTVFMAIYTFRAVLITASVPIVSFYLILHQHASIDKDFFAFPSGPVLSALLPLCLLLYWLICPTGFPR